MKIFIVANFAIQNLNQRKLSLHRCIEIKQEFQDSKVVDIYDVGQNGDLDLSEEFLSSILKQVDNLCDAI